MLDDREWIVEMMQQAFPVLILGRAPKSNRVRFERLPINEQNITIRNLDAALQLVRQITRHRRDYRRGLRECGFEFRFHSRPNVQYRDFQDHILLRAALSRPQSSY